MSFICKNPDCTAPESKRGKAYPSAMECPFCDVPLIEVLSFSNAELNLINNLPYVIAYPLKRTLSEKHAWTKINLFKDTFLNYLKYLGLLTASEFFNSSLKDKKMVALFQQALAEPSFGTWNQYIRESLNYLSSNHHNFFCPELPAYYEAIETGRKKKLYKGEIEYIDSNGDVQLKKQEATAISMLINFRNRYLGHGLTLEEAASTALWEEYFPIFRSLLEQMNFTGDYSMFKHEHGETYRLQSAEIKIAEHDSKISANVWLEKSNGESLDILPFFVVPGELSIAKENKEQILAYESYTGKTIKFFSPEGTEKQTSGKILDRLNLLLREKQKTEVFTPENFTKEMFLAKVQDENKLMLDTLIAEKKIIPGVYVHRKELELKLREWIGARAAIFFIAAEAGSGKTNLLAEVQKQYAERGLCSVFIRAGRMEKQSIHDQLAYVLNIDASVGIESYPSVIGTQSEPVFVLVDGLNEAFNAENLWLDILNVCKKVEPGSLKFVITNRANSSADLQRYAIQDDEMQTLYSEKNENEKGLAASTFWLTALNMEEMKSAWEHYLRIDKNRFKPLFTFDEIAGYDRAIYNLISNPLTLRIFLETYKGRKLPQKGIPHLNVWEDWFKTFSAEERKFLELLAKKIWDKGRNELLLDDCLNDEMLKPYFLSDTLNAPYLRMKNLGWISRYTKELNACVGFTVEGALLYLIGKQLQENTTPVDLNFVKKIVREGSKLQKAGLEEFLCEEALNGELQLSTALIDAGEPLLALCIRPLTYYLKTAGAEETLAQLLKETTDNDWIALNRLDAMLDELQLQVLRKQMLSKCIQHIKFKSQEETLLGLKAIKVLDDQEAKKHYAGIDFSLEFINDNERILAEFAHCEKRFANYDKALEFYQKSLNIELKTLEEEHSDVATTYNNIAVVWYNKSEYDKALEFYQKSLNIRLKTLGEEHPSVANSYNNIGLVWDKKGEYEKALEFYQKSLNIKLKTLGEEHPSVANSYNNIGLFWNKKGQYDKALEFYQKSLNIYLKSFGEEHPSVANSYNNIGLVWDKKGEYEKALEFYQKSLNIKIKTSGEEHPSLANSYNNIGTVWNKKGQYNKALEFYQKSLNIRLKTFGEVHPDVSTSYNNIAVVWHNKGEYDKALEFYNKSLNIRLKNLGEEHPSVATSYNNIGRVWNNKGEYVKALEFYQKSLNIRLKTLGEEHPDVANTYNNLGQVWNKKGEYNKALEFYQKCLQIELKTLGEEHSDVATSYFTIGTVLKNKTDYQQAIETFKKGYKIRRSGSFPFQIAQCYEAYGNKKEALNFYIESAEIRKSDSTEGIKAKSTTEAIVNAIRLAKEVNKEDELPDWMKNEKQ